MPDLSSPALRALAGRMVAVAAGTVLTFGLLAPATASALPAAAAAVTAPATLLAAPCDRKASSNCSDAGRSKPGPRRQACSTQTARDRHGNTRTITTCG